MPIYEGERASPNIVGILFVKDLILVDPDDELEIATVMAFRGRNVGRWGMGYAVHEGALRNVAAAGPCGGEGGQRC